MASDNRILSESQDFIVPSDAPNNEYVGYVKAYPEFEMIGSAPTFVLKTNVDNIYAVSSAGLITISNNASLGTGTDIIVVTVSKTNFNSVDINVSILCISSANCIYIDPSGSNGVGTRADPKNVFPSIVSNTNYLLKRGMTLTVAATTYIQSGKTNIIIGSYSTGDRPIIQSSDEVYLFWINQGDDSITLRDIRGTTSEPDRSNPDIPNMYNNWTKCFFWENTTTTNFRVVNCEIDHCYWGGQCNNGSAVDCTENVNYLWNYVHDLCQDGFTIYGNEYKVNSIGYIIANKIITANLGWNHTHDHVESAGDCIQVEHFNEFYFHHNYLDASAMGGCACIVTEGEDIEWVEIYNNYCIGDSSGNDPTDYETSSPILGIQFSDGEIHNNIFIGTAIHTNAMYVTAEDLGLGIDVYYNIFVNLSGGCYGGYHSMYNNVFYGCGKNFSSDPDHYIVRGNGDPMPPFKNNIIYFTATDQLVYVNYEVGTTEVDYNLYNSEHTSMFWVDGDTIADMQNDYGKEMHSIVGDPLFVNAGSDFHLQVGSPAINAGTNVSLSFDFDGVSVGIPPEIGAYEFGAGTSGIHIENPMIHSIHVNS